MADELRALRENLAAEFADVYARPNPPDASDWVRHAEALGLRAQQIVDSHNSTGRYYEVWALYEPDVRIFGTTPLALIFEDYSTSVCLSWLVEVEQDN